MKNYPIKQDDDDGKWWVTKTAEVTAPYDSIGPYDTRKEAVEGRQGLNRFKEESHADH